MAPARKSRGPNNVGVDKSLRVCHEIENVTNGRTRIYASATERKRAQAGSGTVLVGRIVSTPKRQPVVAVADHADPVGALTAWASTTLIVPPGHPRAGEPMTLPDFRRGLAP